MLLGVERVGAVSAVDAAIADSTIEVVRTAVEAGLGVIVISVLIAHKHGQIVCNSPNTHKLIAGHQQSLHIFLKPKSFFLFFV